MTTTITQNSQRGKFIAFEGIDGSGKTTQVINVVKTIFDLNKNNQVFLTREPTWRSKEIRSKLDVGDVDANWLTKAFVKDREMHINIDIKPSLLNNINVVCDRYYQSTLAYQGAQGVDLIYLRDLHKDWLIEPDLTILLDCPVEIASKRCQGNDAFDKNFEFQKQLRTMYLCNAHEMTIIDASLPLERVSELVSQQVVQLFKQ